MGLEPTTFCTAREREVRRGLPISGVFSRVVGEAAVAAGRNPERRDRPLNEAQEPMSDIDHQPRIELGCIQTYSTRGHPIDAGSPSISGRRSQTARTECREQ
jgi:hypothetical protein